jgi:hypothetical protein
MDASSRHDKKIDRGPKPIQRQWNIAPLLSGYFDISFLNLLFKNYLGPSDMQRIGKTAQQFEKSDRY